MLVIGLKTSISRLKSGRFLLIGGHFRSVFEAAFGNHVVSDTYAGCDSIDFASESIDFCSNSIESHRNSIESHPNSIDSAVLQQCFDLFHPDCGPNQLTKA